MVNRAKTKVPMPEQAPEVRNQNFAEVTLGYTLEMAREEAERCLNCKHKPCVGGCPVNVPIPEFIEALAAGEVLRAYEVIAAQNRLPGITGRVCPQENQCERVCVRGKNGESVAIGRLERFVADYVRTNNLIRIEQPVKNGIKVAVVGSGPAGITCANELAQRGYEVTIFEALHELGGVLVYGIPEFRLPKQLVKAEIDQVLELGVTVHKNVIVGQSVLFEDLFAQGYRAVFIGSGAGLPRFMNIPGESLNGVYSANEFLTRVNLMKAYRKNAIGTPIKTGDKVAVVGGGNVAMDAARTAKRLGAGQVSIVYRRSEQELPARLEEVHHAKEEGIEFRLLANPTRILGESGRVSGMEIIHMQLGEPDASGRRSPVEIAGSEEILAVDSVVIAIGQTPNPIIKRAEPDIVTNRHGCIVIDEASCMTSMENVYAGGDVVTGAATVILAMGAGKKAAAEIDKKLSNKSN
ncbi:glutamate synthase (NADPH), homotetrameric [Lachnospiraceae bacterium oral taxon 500]|nr:glutamate synthase (NADPH), homotetrameric [Lachnospiraceae bacterium oral taxon 500]